MKATDTGGPILSAGRPPRRSAACSTCSASPWTSERPGEVETALADSPAIAQFRRAVAELKMFETGLKAIDLLRAIPAGRQGRAVRRRRRRQDRDDQELIRNIATEAWRLFRIWRRRRTDARGQRALARDAESSVVSANHTTTALVFGQMNEPPGARLRVALVRADHSRVLPRHGEQGRAPVHRQHFPLSRQAGSKCRRFLAECQRQSATNRR